VLVASLAVLLTAAPAQPTLFLQVSVDPASPCRVEGLAAAVRALRPEASVAVGPRPLVIDLDAEISERAGTLTLTVRGKGKPLARALPPPGTTCQATMETAALMIDRYLDELNEGEEVRIEELGGPSPAKRDTALDVLIGASVVQAPAGLSPGVDLAFAFRLGLFEMSLGGEINLAQNEAATGVSGSYHLQPAAVWLGAGVAPRVGPGRLVAQTSFGLSLLWVNIESADALFQKQQGHAVDPFAGLSVGYVLDLSTHFSLALRYEERWVPAPTSFSIEGFPGSVSVREFAGDLALMAGYRLF